MRGWCSGGAAEPSTPGLAWPRRTGEIAVSIRAPRARAPPRTSLAKAHREIAVSIRAPRAGATPRTSLAKAHREIAVQSAPPARGRPRTSLAKAHREIAVSIRAPRAGGADTNYSGYGTDCALKEKAVSLVIGRREYIMSKPDGAIASGAKG